MNLRHAAALALVGWYLIMPPVVGVPPKALPDATFDQWHTMDVFDSIAECKNDMGKLRSFTAKTLQIDPKAYQLGSRPSDPVEAQKWDKQLTVLKSALADAAHHAGCIASDDPRLKGK